jgi:hypothetical protein
VSPTFQPSTHATSGKRQELKDDQGNKSAAIQLALSTINVNLKRQNEYSHRRRLVLAFPSTPPATIAAHRRQPQHIPPAAANSGRGPRAGGGKVAQLGSPGSATAAVYAAASTPGPAMLEPAITSTSPNQVNSTRDAASDSQHHINHLTNQTVFATSEPAGPRAVEGSSSFVQKQRGSTRSHQNHQKSPDHSRGMRLDASTASPTFRTNHLSESSLRSSSFAYAKAFRSKVLLNLQQHPELRRFPQRDVPEWQSFLQKQYTIATQPASTAEQNQALPLNVEVPAPSQERVNEGLDSNSSMFLSKHSYSVHRSSLHTGECKQNKIGAYLAIRQPRRLFNQTSEICQRSDAAAVGRADMELTRRPFQFQEPHLPRNVSSETETKEADPSEDSDKQLQLQSSELPHIGNPAGIAPLIASRSHQVQLAVVDSAPLHEQSSFALPIPLPSSSVVVETHRFSLPSDTEVHTNVEAQMLDIETPQRPLRANLPLDLKLPWELQSLDESIAFPDARLHETRESDLIFSGQSENEMNDKKLDLKIELVSIVDMVTSKDPDEHVDGLLMLGVFMNEYKESINWDGLMIVFREIMRFIPSLEETNWRLERTFQETLLLFDTACFCIGRMCNGSHTILNLARSLDAVPRILSLLKYMRMNYFLNRIQL